MTTGYWRDPQVTAETLRGGWLQTADVGAFDADAFLTLKDGSASVPRRVIWSGQPTG